MSRLPHWFALLLFPLSLVGQPLAAATVEELQAQNRLTIDASISPIENVVAGQKLALVIEIATDRWFTGGTRLSRSA